METERITTGAPGKLLVGGVFGATFGVGLGLVQWAAFLRALGITRLWIVFSAVGGMAAALLDREVTAPNV